MQTTDSLEQAAESLLIQPTKPEEVDADAGPQVNATDEEEAEASDEAAEGEAEQDAPEDDEEAEEVEAEASDDDETDDADEEGSDGDEQPQTFKVKVDGQEREVTLDDLTRSYSGQAYIQKGMEEAANKRKEAEELYSVVEQQRQQFIQAVQTMQQSGLKAPPQPPSKELLDSDPIGYMQEQARYQEEVEAYQAQTLQIQQLQQQHQQAMQQAQAKFLDEQREKMRRLVPELGDAQKAPEFQKRLFTVGAEAYGLTEQDFANLVDARHVQILADAMRYRELKAGKAEAQKPKPKPKTVKPTGRRKPSRDLARQKQKAAAKKSGKLEDFAALIMETNGLE